MSTQPEHKTWTPEWSFADRLRKIRRESGAKQEDFAARLGVNDNQYKAWETGRNHPRDQVATAKRIELMTGVPAVWVLGLEEEKPTDGDPLGHVMPGAGAGPRSPHSL
ncbi:helix-turn-helix transcriptional regulator [Arthrobacter sp. HLT1-21]